MGRRAITTPILERLAERSVEIDGCLVWRGNRPHGRYGQIKIDAQPKRVSRVAYEAFYDTTLRADEYVLHTCDNPPCWKKEHLFLGTARDNTADMIAKGRRFDNAGERNGNSKLSVEVVRGIRTSPASQTEIASKYGLHQSTVSRIRSGDRWGSV